MAEQRIASGEIFIGLNDESARLGLEKIERDFARTMQRIEHEEATVELRATYERLKSDLKKAEAETRKYEKYVKDADTKRTADARKKSLERVAQQEKEARAAVVAHEKIMRATDEVGKAEARQAAAREAEFRREQQRNRLAESVAKKRLAAAKAEERQAAANQKTEERLNASRDRAGILAARQERDVARLNRRYSEAAARVRAYRKELDSIRLPREQRQKIDLNAAEAAAEMRLIQTELEAMGRKPIHQKISLDVDKDAVSTLDRWIKAITDTTVRVGPFTTTMAGLGRTLLLLGPIVSGLVGQLSALVAVVGGGVAGAMGVGAGAIGAFGVSLGGVGLLLPSLLRDFKNLNTMQAAYHKQVLKTGANSDKAKAKLKEFNHALGEVTPTTRKAFDAYDKLQDRWRKLRVAARPDFLAALGSALDTVNHHFDFFGRNTLQAFHNLRVGWDSWMKGLRSREADQVFHRLGREGNRSIAPLMSGLGHLGAAFGRIAAEFSRFLPGLLRGFDQWAANIDTASTHADTLHKRARRLVDAMQSVGRFTMAAARVIMAFFLPGVDDGTNMVNKWATGLNHLADSMEGRGRKGIDQWFKESIVTANKFWQALKPLAQLFFEWTNIMRPFTNVALDVLKVVGDILQTVLDFGPTKTVFQGVFFIFLYGALLKRISAFRDGLASIYSIITGIRAAGGIGGVLKGGLIKFISGGMAGRGTTPANPLFVMPVGGGLGGGGLPGAAGRGGGGVVGAAEKGGGSGLFGGLLRTLPRLVKFGGGIGALAGGMWELSRAAEKLSEKRGLEIQDKQLQHLVDTRNMRGLINMRNGINDWARGGKGNSDKFVGAINNAIAVLDKLNQQDLHRVTNSMDTDYSRMRRQGKMTFERISGLAKYHFNLIRTTMTKGSFQAQQAASHNFNLAKGAIQSAMKAGTISTRKGMALIEKLWEQALSQYGFSPRQARNIRKGLNPTGGPSEGTVGVGAGGVTRGGPRARKARGGLMQVGRPGEVGPDSVPMNLGGVPSVVAPGEQIAVFNRHQQKKFAHAYPGGLPGFFSGPQKPHHYDIGGMVNAANQLESKHFPYRWGGGHERTPAPLEPVDCSGAVSYVLQHGGVNIPTMTSGSMMNIGKPGPGAVTLFANPKHVFMRIGNRYFGTSQSNPGGGAGWIEQAPSPAYIANFTQRHFGPEDIGAGFADSIKAPIVEGLGGALGASVQGALDQVTAAANQNISNVSASFLGGGDSNLNLGSGGSAEAKAYAQSQLGKYGWGPDQWGPLDKLWTKESGWNPNAVNSDSGAAGIPQALGHGNVFSLGDWKAQVDWGLRYIKSTYGSPSGAWAHEMAKNWYAMGGFIDVMGRREWARGGMIDRPTMLTGEDGRKHPEFVISTNPMFKNSNLSTLASAADALGVPQARKGHNAKKHHTKKKKPTHGGKATTLLGQGSLVPKYVKGAGRDVASIPSVKHYTDLQAREDDTNRQISINASKVKEPDSFLKQTGKDEAGNPIFSIDQSVVDAYQAQLKSVLDLWDKMLGPKGIMDQLAKTAQRAYKDINAYIGRRYANIEALNNTISIDRVLARSKDDKTANRAQSRLDKANSMRDSESQKVADARDMQKQIQDDQHDAYFRRQEYSVDRDSVRADYRAVGGRAADELAQNAPTTDTTTAPDPGQSLLEQTATYSQARSDLLQSMGSNFAPVMAALGRTMGIGASGGTMMQVPGQAARRAVAQAGSVSGMFNGTAPLTTSSGAAITPSRAAGMRTVQPVGVGTPLDGTISGAVQGAGVSGTAIHVENLNFPVAPTDPHTFSKNLLWELGALSNA